MSALSLLHPNKQTVIAAAGRNLPGYLKRGCQTGRAATARVAGGAFGRVGCPDTGGYVGTLPTLRFQRLAGRLSGQYTNYFTSERSHRFRLVRGPTAGKVCP